MEKQRLDESVVARGLAASRSRARDLILRGLVLVDGEIQLKPAAMVGDQVKIAVQSDAAGYVSRGAEKLIAALDHFGFEAAGKIALDIGASTGGFTEVLLRRGAEKVYAVDVGHGQLHERLRGEPRIVALENLDARMLDASVVPDPVSALVADVSFISVTKVLSRPMALTMPGAWLVVLIKPQFEAGPLRVGKGGIVRQETVHQDVAEGVKDWVTRQQGWRVMGVIPSPVLGGSGNREFLLGAVRNA